MRSLIDMSIEDMLMDPWKADEAFVAGFKKHGGLDMAEVGFLLAKYLSPTPDIFSTLYFDWHLPGRERDPYDIPNLNERAREDPFMTEGDYDLVLKHGLHRFFSFRRAGRGPGTADGGHAGDGQNRAQMAGGVPGSDHGRRRHEHALHPAVAIAGQYQFHAGPAPLPRQGAGGAGRRL